MEAVLLLLNMLISLPPSVINDGQIIYTADSNIEN